ncbi:MAG: 2-C-methyl-D-erythritol 4-phosphate cytidylyltransferase [Negativicutes bacterium]|nr:2-C-methyl-D-erythritol 4-phosphate cytidylyltransferase [Negativicutes bacterium]
MIAAVVPAAGSGRRMAAGKNKVLLPLAGRTVIELTVDRLLASRLFGRVVVVAGAAEVAEMSRLLAGFSTQAEVAVVAGGAERQWSVACGLAAIGREWEYIAVHDAARPLVSRQALAAVVADARQYGAAVLAAPVRDTIKQDDGTGFVAATLERCSLWAVQTPQVFRADWLREAHRRAGEDGVVVTDDAALVERLGHKVRITVNPDDNLKLTTPVDWQLAEILAREELTGGTR